MMQHMFHSHTDTLSKDAMHVNFVPTGTMTDCLAVNKKSHPERWSRGSTMGVVSTGGKDQLGALSQCSRQSLPQEKVLNIQLALLEILRSKF